MPAATTGAHADAVARLVDQQVAKAADWQTVTVTAVGTDGTLTVQGGDGSSYPKVRRTRVYVAPLVGDVVVMHRSRNGNRYAQPPLSTGATWITLPLASGWSAHGGSPAYRLESGRVWLRGSVQTSGSVSSGATFATLPTGFRAANSDFYGTTYSIGSGPAATYVTANTDGTLVYNGSTGTVAYLMLGGMTIPTI